MSEREVSSMPGLTYPPDWEDDERMHYLLGPFPPSAISSLTLTHPKVQFWSSLISRSCRAFRQPIFSEHQMTVRYQIRKLQWRSQAPSCLHHVLAVMVRVGKLQAVRNEERAMEGVRGWISWSVSVLGDYLNWGGQGGGNKMYMDTHLLQELTEAVLQQLQVQVKFKSTDQLLTGAQLMTVCMELLEESSVAVVEKELVRQGKIGCKTSKGLKVVKFAMSGDSLPVSVSEVDEGVLSLKESIITLQKHICALAKTMERLKRTARDQLNHKQKQLALNNLRRSRQTQHLITNKTAMLSNMESILQKIQMAETDVLVLEAYHKGAQALKSLYSSTLVRAEDVIDELHEAIQLGKEVGGVLGEDVSAEEEMNEEELERELEALLTDPETSATTVQSDDSLLSSQLASLELISPPTGDLAGTNTRTPAAALQ